MLFAQEHDNGKFWTIQHFDGWYTVMMSGDGFGYTLTIAEH